jgi:hypothetical protein
VVEAAAAAAQLGLEAAAAAAAAAAGAVHPTGKFLYLMNSFKMRSWQHRSFTLNTQAWCVIY